MIVRAAALADAAAIAEIYNHYVETSHATFELEPVGVNEMERRIRDTLNPGFPFLVAEDEGAVLGYAFGRPFRPWPGYKYTVEVAVYVDENCHGKGIARALYRELFDTLFEAGAHSLIATIALPNEASVRLHEKFGFVKAGHFREVGRKFDRWIDVGYWQLLRPNKR